MRTRLLMLIGALLLACRMGAAQTPQAPQTAQAPQPSTQTPAVSSTVVGTVDIGGLFTTVDGDEARFERYRDTRDGLYSSFVATRHNASSLFDASALHVGYRDQRYATRIFNSKLNLRADWIGLPLNFSYLTRTPFVTSGSVLTLDDGAQRAVQGPTFAPADGTAVGVPCAPGAPPAACGTPAQAAQAIANRSIYNALATPFDLRYTRDTGSVGLRYAATGTVDVDGSLRYVKRDGQQPFGASFAFNNAVEVPLPIDQRTTDMTLGASWTNPHAMFRLGWDGSWFHNQYLSMTWDNPIFLNDYTNGLLPPNGPYDPSGYSNGNGPAHGRMALAPSNNMNVVSGTGMYKLPGRTTLNGTVQFTEQNQNEPLIPWTINPLISDTPAVIAAFPHLASLPRATAEAKAKGINTLINLSARPYRHVNFAVRYRYNKRDVQTPVFDATEYVRFDAVPEENPEGFSPQFDNARHYLDANVAFTPTGWGTLRVGYGREAVTREGRGFADVAENIFRISYDAYSSRFVTLRASFDAGRRRGSGFVEAESGNDEIGPGGTQPTLRYYDEADRNRRRGSLILTVMPRDTFDLFAQLSGGKDTYLADKSVPVSRPGELFGLQEQSVGSWNFGVNFHPTDVIGAGASYGRDTFGSLQRSRNANPPPDPTWTDPSRDWTLDNDDKVNNFNAYVDLLRALTKTDIRFSYDYSDSDNSFVHGGPRIAGLSALGQFIPLPNVTNAWHRATVDVHYFLTNKAGIGFGWYFEKLDVADFNTIDTNGPVGFATATGTPRIDWLGELMLGYGNRPYSGNSVYVRLLYRF
jgi:putative beta-barrel porin MtrB/PioB